MSLYMPNPIIKDISNIFINKKKENRYLNLDHYSNKNNKTNLNTKEPIFNMSLDNLLNKLKERRLQTQPLLLKDKESIEPINTFVTRINQTFNEIHLSKPTIGNYRYKSQKYSFIPPVPSITPKKRTKINIDVQINTLDDILNLCKKYPLKPDCEYNINMQAIHNIKDPLTELKNMIGMERLKDSILDQILYFIQDLHLSKDKKNNDFMHTVIYGPPGTGKTEVAKLMGKIFSKMGVLSKNIFKKATRADLIAGYLGQTAIKTKDLVSECLGGVLFIDEAYALGNPEKRDSFAKECIDTLCELLSDHKDNLMVIIAGYEKELKNCFFKYNQGLESRFTWRFNTTDYTANELKAIFEKKVYDASWDFKTKPSAAWFQTNIDYFKYFGRDIETLFAKTKIAHSRRVFCKKSSIKKKLTIKDVEKGFELYKANGEIKEKKFDYKDLYL